MSSWKKVRLGDYIHEYSKRNKDNANIPVYSVTNINGFCTEYFSKEVASKDKTTYKIVKKGFFAYNPSRINVGSVDWLRDMDRVIVSPLYNVFFVDSALDQQYLYYYLKCPVGLFYIKELASGSVRDNLKFSILSDFIIPFPDLTIQKDIAATLDRIVQIINICNTILDKIDLLVKSRFVEMFGNPITNSHNLPLKTLSELGELGRGISKHRPRNAPELLGGVYPLIQTGDVANASLYILDYNSTYSETGFKQSKMWSKGTLCITIAANIAKTAILTFDSCFPDSVVGFNANVSTNNIFIHFWFSFFQEILEEQAPESAQKNINLKILSELKVIVPPIELQQQFADFVAQTDKSKLAVKQILEKAETLKKSLMQEYFG